MAADGVSFKGSWRVPLLVAVAALSPFIAPRPASACDLFLCPLPVSLPAVDRNQPANLLRFLVLVPDPGRLLLRRPAGKPVAASVKMSGGDRVFSPDVEVSASEPLELVYHCSNNPNDPSGERTYPFVTGAPQTPSLEPGELSIEERGIEFPADASKRALVATVRYRPRDGLGVGWPVVRTAMVDGHALLWNGAQGYNPYELLDAEPTVRLTAPCAPEPADLWLNSCGPTNRVPARKLTLTVTSHLIGSEADPPPATIDIDLRCDQSATADPGTGGASPPAVPALPSEMGGGCGYGGRAPSTIPTVVVAAAACWLRSRRRRHPS